MVHSVSFGYRDLDTWLAVALGHEEGHIYSRNTNPTVRAFEEKVRDLEAAEAATSFSTGMAAISATFFTFLRPGDRVVSIKDSYGGTNKLFTEFLPAFGIEATLVRDRRPCGHRGRDRPGMQAPVSGVADQSDRQDHGHRPARGARLTRAARWSRWTTRLPRRSIRIR